MLVGDSLVMVRCSRCRQLELWDVIQCVGCAGLWCGHVVGGMVCTTRCSSMFVCSAWGLLLLSCVVRCLGLG
jgi:hypothetical protein